MAKILNDFLFSIFTIKTKLTVLLKIARRGSPQSSLQSRETEVSFLPSEQTSGYCWDLFSREDAGYQRCPCHPSPPQWVVIQKAACRDTPGTLTLPVRPVLTPIQCLPCPHAQYPAPSLVRNPVRFTGPVFLISPSSVFFVTLQHIKWKYKV